MINGKSYTILCESYMILLDYFMVINNQNFYAGPSKSATHKRKENSIKQSVKRATTSDKPKYCECNQEQTSSRLRYLNKQGSQIL